MPFVNNCVSTFSADAASPTAISVTQTPLLGVNGSGILHVNLTGNLPANVTDNKPKVSDPIVPDDSKY